MIDFDRAIWVFDHLSKQPQGELSWLDRTVAFFSTNLGKRLGISGWTDLSCYADGRGVPLRDAQHSTDGFWTIDVALSFLRIGSLVRWTPGRFLRLEVEPGRRAHVDCAARPPKKGDKLAFQGPVLIDNDGEGFLEVHPDYIWFV